MISYDSPRACRSEPLQGGTLWRRDLRVPMRDGILLAADLYSASADPEATALPVLLERTPYGRRAQRGSDQDRGGMPVPQPEDVARFFAEARYHVVRQDCRGRGDSGGTFVKYLGEGPDGADTIAWLRDQPWCDGRVVMTGVSYSAHVQAAAAAEGVTGLAAMFQDSGGFSSAYDAGMRMGGAFELKQVTWALRQAARSPEAAADPVLAEELRQVDVAGWFGAMPWRPGCTPLRHLPLRTRTSCWSSGGRTPSGTSTAARRSTGGASTSASRTLRACTWAAGTTPTSAPPSRTSPPCGN